MTLSSVVLLSLLVAVLGGRFQAPFGHQASSSSDTSTSSSSDSDSHESSIASAVEAALRAANQSPNQPIPRTFPYQKYRLRLSTTHNATTCTEWDCATEIETCQIEDLENAVVAVENDDGETYYAKFDNAGEAVALDDAVDFTVTATSCTSFTLSTTTVNDHGLNVTSLTISTQVREHSVNGGFVYFEPIGPSGEFNGKWDGRNHKIEIEATLFATRGPIRIGCDATFDGASTVGRTSFTITPLNEDDDFLVGTVTDADDDDDDDQSVSFTISSAHVLRPAVNGRNGYGTREQVDLIGLENLPCATRPQIVYEQVAVVSMRGPTKGLAGGELLEHPILYDAFRSSSNPSTPNWEPLIFQLQLAAGRGQIRLRDVTIDQGAFSIFSHDTKFTGCFRAYPDDDFEIYAFIGMRGNGQPEYVRAFLNPGSAGSDLYLGGGQFNEVNDEPDAARPTFDVAEVALRDLKTLQIDETRPREFLRSDVDVVIEDCPDFTYFQ